MSDVSQSHRNSAAGRELRGRELLPRSGEPGRVRAAGPRRAPRWVALLQRVLRWLRRLEARFGADRPGRSGWVWLVPVVTAIGSFLVIAWLDQSGDLDLLTRLPLALLAGAFMGGMSAAYLAAFAADERDSDDEGDGAPVS